MKTRLAIITRNFSKIGGGAESLAVSMATAMLGECDITVVSQGFDQSPELFRHIPVPRLPIRMRWLNQLWYATVTWWATRQGFDVVHSHENTWHGQVQTVHVLPVRYNLLHGLTGWRLALRWLKVVTSPRLLVYLALERSRFSLKKPRTVVVTSNTLVPQMLEAYPACALAVQVVTPGVDRVSGTATALQKSEARKRLGLPAEGFTILFVGNDYRKKGLGTLISALQLLPGNCFAVVVGHPSQIPQFKAQAAAAGLGQRIHFLGSLPDVTVVYQAADCLAHPTLEDTFAMVVLEAMAHGLPVVVSAEKYCGIAGLLTHEQHVLLLDDPLDEQALATALQRFLHDPALVERLCTAALDFARQHLWAKLAQQQEHIYLKLAQGDDAA